ncbi:MAG TPA: hypothetical protein VMP01_24425 [Pirellulaceae bacterium]|nr:hypothetical protein [Pirellulaceae bacterium]
MRTAIALLLILTTGATAQASWLNRLGRHLGLGWSDGYHAVDPSAPRHFSNFAIPPGGLASPKFVAPSPAPKAASPPLFELPPPQH